ncbi:MAG: lipid-A-disaccharide synthase [bacterium]
MNNTRPQSAVLKIGILAGEASGDNLGAGLMTAMQQQTTQTLEFLGVGGARMQAAGLSPLAPLDALAVNGFRDPILKLPELITLLRRLIRTFVKAEIDVFIGVDFNVFNFILEAALRKRGIRTVHYVSPSVYAWRSGRTKRVARSADLLLCLYPFEPAFYKQTSVQAEFVGHPLADEIDLHAGAPQARLNARQALGLATDTADTTVLALLPGSRNSEVDLMIEHFLGAAAIFAQQTPGTVTVIPCVRPSIKQRVEKALQDHPNLVVKLYEGNARQALIACDVALVKSGTSTLEAMLLHRPMVVSYRLGWWTYQLARRVLRTPFVALPNILAGRALVPELLQHEGTAEALAAALRRALNAAAEDAQNTRVFERLHKQLRQGADAKSAASVLRLLAEKTTGS